MPRRLAITLSLAATLTLAPATLAENWPGWRGPRGDGTSTLKDLPTKWSADDNIAWKVPIPGEGHASPVVWEDRIFLVSCLEDNGDRILLCLDRRNGKELWRRTVLEAPLERKHRLNSYASSTPVTDGRRVFVSFLDRDQMLIAAYDFDGKQLWAKRPGVFNSVHGYCSSPVLYKEKVIINGDHDGAAYLVALDQQTGETQWKTPRENRTRSYCTPIVREIDGRTQMLLSGSKCVASYDPNDGKRHWIIDGPTEQYVASLVYNGDLLFLTCGFPEQHFMGIRPDGRGNVTKSHVAWHHETKDAAYVPSPIAVGEYFLVADDFGTCTCFEAKTGREVWSRKLARHFSASLVASGDGLVYFIADQGLDREKGVTFVIKPGEELDIVATNVLGEEVFASPAIHDGQLLIRGEKHLWCVGK